jgi:DHA2 family multidrug resistance protein
MFRNRNFAISALLMFVLGFALFGTTVLIPLFVQQMMGYTAEQAGLVISPGGIAILVLMPLVGFPRRPRRCNRWLIAIGFAILSAALYALRTIDTQASYSYIAWMRVFQASGLAFLFVPINTLSYTGVPREKNNDVSGLMNLARNIGGSCGTSFFVTVLARRAQDHQDRLAMYVQRRQPPVPAGGLPASPTTCSKADSPPPPPRPAPSPRAASTSNSSARAPSSPTSTSSPSSPSAPSA